MYALTRVIAPLVLLGGLAACSDAVAPGSSTQLLTVSPAPASAGVDPAGPLSVSFSHPMMTMMAQYVDLHAGGVDGPTVPMACSWADSMRTLTCQPNAPLAAQSRYTLHLGGGMRDSAGNPVDMSAWATNGGHWMHTATTDTTMMNGGSMPGGMGGSGMNGGSMPGGMTGGGMTGGGMMGSDSMPGMSGTGMHVGQPLDMMPEGWRHGEHYGMTFEFTTAF